MSQSSALNTAPNVLTVVSKSGDRTTGSPLLDSFAATQKISSQAYIAQPTISRSVPNSFGLGGRRVASAYSPRQGSARQGARLDSQSLPLSNATVVDRQGVSKKSEKVQKSDKISNKTSDGQILNSQDLDDQKQKLGSHKQSGGEVLANQGLFAFKNIEKQSTPLDENAAATKTAAQALKPLRKRLPSPSLERAAAVGMLDLSDKLLFGGEDDTLISTYLGGEDPLMTEGDETVVLKYLSKQITESALSKVKSRLPLAVQSQLEREPSHAVLDAKNFKVVQKRPVEAKRLQNELQNPLKRRQLESDSSQSPNPALDAAAMSQQISYLNQKVEHLTKELSNLTGDTLQKAQSGSDEAA